MSKSKNLVWMDLEMSGLDVHKERIIEIATIVTDEDLNMVAEGPVIAIHQNDALINSMDAWNTKHHGQSGLVDRVRASDVSERDAELRTLQFLNQHASKGKAMLCGNSIWQDRKFLSKYMPELEAFFHYRMVDVSTLKELAKRWAPDVYNTVNKEAKHQALEDIKESIDEMRHYRNHFLKF